MRSNRTFSRREFTQSTLLGGAALIAGGCRQCSSSPLAGAISLDLDWLFHGGDAAGAELLLNINSSPYHRGKRDERYFLRGLDHTGVARCQSRCDAAAENI